MADVLQLAVLGRVAHVEPERTRLEVVEIDRKIQFLLEHGLRGGADRQMHVAAGRRKHFQQPQCISGPAGPGNGDDDVLFHRNKGSGFRVQGREFAFIDVCLDYDFEM